jgi:hypothetical protein
MKRVGNRVLWGCARFACVLLAGCWPVVAQAVPQSSQSQQRTNSDARIAALDQSLRETRAELAETRAEIRQLRSLLEELVNKKTAIAAPTAAAAPSQPPQTQAKRATAASRSNPPGSQHLARITEDDWQILNAKVEEHAQDKVESGSKYRVKLWGLALFNAFGVSGHVDDLDVPTRALPRAAGNSSGSLGASLRQSIVGITGTGPDILGARTSADLQMDFFGGLPSGYGGGSSGVFRLRLSRIRFDWDHTSVIGGLDTPFFSPNVPTSFMSVAVPAFASAGNLWTWSPTIRVEHRFDTSVSQFKVEAGFLAPSGYAAASAGIRQPTPGESSRQPVYAVRFSANGTHGDRPASLGISGLYFPQRFPGGVRVSGWGGILDWRFPLIPHTELSGEFFAGKGLDSFGGVPVPNIRQQDYNDYIQVGAPDLANIPMLGGWSQLKVVLDSRNEFNVAVGTGGRKASSLVQVALLAPSLDYLSPRSQMMFVNYIFHPRSDLLFSTEYRRLRTFFPYGSPATADQFGIAAGFLF